jgi:hypothetical protein
MYIPKRFAGKPAVWFGRKTVVARRRATVAAREGRAAWAALWERAARLNAGAWNDYLDE